MKKKKYDVAVIGAGPAGSVCAKNLAGMGYDVLLCEKRPVVGVPVRCGEATGARKRLSEFAQVNEDWIETDIHGVMLHAGSLDIRYDKHDIGLMIDRALFDQDLAGQAERAGAELCLNARVSDVLSTQNKHRGVRVVYDGQEEEIQASVVIGADGAETLCGRWAGLKCRHLPSRTCSALEFRIEGEYEYPNHLSFWTAFSGIDTGYVWVFPKLKSQVINIGAGNITPGLNEPNMHETLMKFKQEYFPDYKILAAHGGAVPVSGNLEESVSDRFLLAGDAAHHTNPLTGGGIMSSMQAGFLASKWVHRAFVKGDFSRDFFRRYEEDCWDKIGKSHRRQMRIRDFILGLTQQEEERFFQIIKSMAESGFSLVSKALGYGRIYGLMLRNPGLVWRILQDTRKPFKA
ncbi:NAD(P)/FAD-dependent oxidoreductase [Fibrobacterota bacterium]